ncbi:MAG TPA: YciI family protein [Conexibacter sp.]|nr:YciI family protein [Conexibacter sp.]
MRHMLLVYETGERPHPDSAEGQQAMEEHAAFMEECLRRGAFVAADPLIEPSGARTVRTRDGEPIVSDGPFAETREWLGGYYILDCEPEEALELAARCPGGSDEAAIEVRRILELPGPHADVRTGRRSMR